MLLLSVGRPPVLLFALAARHAIATAFVLPSPHLWAIRPSTAPPRPTHHAESFATNDDECSLEGEGVDSCLESEGYVKDDAASSFATISEVFVAEIESLRGAFPSFEEKGGKNVTNVIKYNRRRSGHRLHSNGKSSSSSQTKGSHVDMEYNNIVSGDEVVLFDTIRRPGMKTVSRAFRRAGPRRSLHFDPSEVNAAIVTCGGLCPGLNNVIRELVHSLFYLYDARSVYGITGGFNGFHMPEYEPVLLTNQLVENIHHEGGTILRSARGGFDIDKILTFLREKNISQLYIIGGDGTHRGAYAISEACSKEEMNVAVVGIPKTIDNDIDYIDRSFGFSSAVEAAQAGIRVAKTEAMCNVPNGIGIVKLMGRSAGFLAAFAALGSGDVDLVLVPEVPIVLEGPDGILPYLRKRVKENKFAVVVVAEGAGEELLGASTEVDAGGNRALPKIGQFIKKTIEDYFEKQGDVATIKYVDPSYTVRSVPANAADSLYCTMLSQNAVHGAMAGMTGFSVGLVNNQAVYLPIPLVVATSPRTMNPSGTTWERIIAMTGQPNTATSKEELVSEDEQFGIIPEPTFQ